MKVGENPNIESKMITYNFRDEISSMHVSENYSINMSHFLWGVSICRLLGLGLGFGLGKALGLRLEVRIKFKIQKNTKFQILLPLKRV